MGIDRFVTSLHRLWMRRVRYLSWAALPLGAVLLSVCAVLNKQELQPAPKTLTHGRFVYLANRVCRRDIRQTLRIVKRPKNHAQYDKELQAVLKGYEQALFDPRALAPPPSDAKQFERVLAPFNYEDLLGHNRSRRVTRVRPQK